MHQQDFTGDSSAARKMSYPNRRASSTTGSGSASGSSNVPTDQSTTLSRSTSPGSHHHPQSLPQSLTSGSQVKKKSGFQITSVTPAQISVSTNNSIADDTESYDDMDESHTEDLSSSEMLDVSVPRTTDTGVPERSSSDETLNSLHGVETPGVASPNEPLHPQSLPQAPASEPLPPVVPPLSGHTLNGTGCTPQGMGAATSSGSLVVGTSAGGSGTNTGQREQTMVESITTKSSANTAGPGVDVSSVSMASDGPPAADSLLRSSSGVGFLPGGPAGSTQLRVMVALAQPTTSTTTQTHAAPGSRFRVVKLDSNSEPFRKGRWMCTEYYEKEMPAAAPTSDPALCPACPESEAGSVATGSSVVQYGVADVVAVAPQTLPGYQPPLPHDIPSQEANPLLQQRTLLPPATAPRSQAVPQPVSYTPDHSQTGYLTPQLQAGLVRLTGSRPPDFIQPTAPLQSQVLPPGTLGVSGPAQPLQSQLQNPSAPFVTSLRSDLKPLLTHGVMSHTGQGHGAAPYGGGFPNLTASQLEDAQRLLFRHQSLLTLPRLGAAGGDGVGGGLGTAMDASTLAAAAASLKTHSADEEEDSSSGSSLVAIDNKIEQAMDLVKSHLMYAVREEVEVLKEQIKDLIERNSQLEQENLLLKTLASPEQLAQFQVHITSGSPTGTSDSSNSQPQVVPSSQSSGTSA
ncbi:hypothetical protein DPEC_G00147330 [Dallia pectoralis]|uniref:Uncharacterized protein n=1 Tax=Dallia pectoralis TaxID=75939 RepID=A0ACC2GIH4_DALPE|nr:hypothetical protein DPEC_G00147330 [Dallia pectoralis]